MAPTKGAGSCVGEAESVAEPGLLRAHEAPRARSVALGACGQGGKGK